MPNLSLGLFSRIASNEITHADKIFGSTVQVIGMKTLNPSRVQLLLYDGMHSMTGMLASQFTSRVDVDIVTNVVLRLVNCLLSDVGHQKVIVIVNLEVVGINDPPSVKPQPAMPLHLPQAPAQGNSSYGNPPPSNPTYGNAPASNPTYGNAPASNPTYGNAPATTNPYGNQSASIPTYGNPNPYGNAPTANPTYGNQPLTYGNQPSTYGNQPSTYGNQPSTYGNSSSSSNRAILKDESAGGLILPIRDINPYSNKWTIKARITAKSELRRWSNAKGEGTLFSIDLLDSMGGEIKGTFFKDACDKFFPVLEEGKVYTFSGGTLKVVQNRQYSTIKNQYELTFSATSVILASDDAGISKQQYNFVKISTLDKLEINSTVDVVAIVRAATDINEIVSTKLNGKVLQKRDLTLIDDSMHEIKLTLWGDKATSPHYCWDNNPVLAVKGAKIGDYNGRNLGSLSSTVITLNPDIPEGQELHMWKCKFNGAIPVGASMSTGGAGAGGGMNDSIENRVSLMSIREQSLGQGEKADYVTVKAVINFIKHDNDVWYTACTQPGCNKKVIEVTNGWSCEKCNKVFPACSRRYILNLTITDQSGNFWITCFNEEAEKVLNCSAQDLYELRSQNFEDYERVFQDALFSEFIARLRVKQELVNDEQRLKAVGLVMTKLSYAAECAQMLQVINKYK